MQVLHAFLAAFSAARPAAVPSAVGSALATAFAAGALLYVPYAPPGQRAAANPARAAEAARMRRLAALAARLVSNGSTASVIAEHVRAAQPSLALEAEDIENFLNSA